MHVYVPGSHVGGSPDHIPPTSHTLILDPFNTYPSSQLYVATEPMSLPDENSIFPFTGGGSVPQFDKAE